MDIFDRYYKVLEEFYNENNEFQSVLLEFRCFFQAYFSNIADSIKVEVYWIVLNLG